MVSALHSHEDEPVARELERGEAGLPRPVADLTGVAAMESPARRLQREIEGAFTAADERRWSPRATVAFLAATNGLLWLAIVWAVRGLL
jgi:hypothetical protein